MYQSGLIQTSVFWCVLNGENSYEAWYEYIPAVSIAYSMISVSAGNQIKVTATKGSSTVRVTTFDKQLSTEHAATHTFNNFAQIIYIEQNNKILTTTTISGGADTVQYD